MHGTTPNPSLPPSHPLVFVNFYILKIVKAGFFISEELLYIYLVLIKIFVLTLFFSHEMYQWKIMKI